MKGRPIGQPTSRNHSLTPPKIFSPRIQGSWLASIRLGDFRYRLEAYATLTGVRSMGLADWTPLQHLQPKDGVLFTMGAKGLGWRASTLWTFDNRLEAYATLTGVRSMGWPIGRPFSISSRRKGCFSPREQRVLAGELPSRGRSIQAGSLCYNNGCAVEGLAGWTPLQHLQAGGPGVFHHGYKGSWLASFRPVVARYRLEAYATITGARSMWLPDWTPLASPARRLCLVSTEDP